MIKKYLFCTITTIILVTVALTGLISCGGGGGSSGQPPSVIIEPPPVQNRAPVTRIGNQAYTLNEGDTRTIDMRDWFSDPDGDSLSYFESSNRDSVLTAEISGTQLTIRTHGAGRADIAVSARDPSGLNASVVITVTVNPPQVQNRAPVTRIGNQAYTLDEGDTRTIDMRDWFSDPDGDSLSYFESSNRDSVLTAEISGTQLTIRTHGAGRADIVVTARDPSGLNASVVITVTVNPPQVQNRAPVTRTGNKAYTLDEGETRTIEMRDWFSDPDGDTLTYLESSNRDSVLTTEISGTQLTIRTHGAGRAAIVVSVSDPGGLGSTAILITVTVNPPPVQNRAPVTIFPGGINVETPTLNVGDTHPVRGIDGWFDDPDGDRLNYSVESSRESVATAAVVSFNMVEITARGGGSATITVTATDPGGLTATNDFTITVNQPTRRPPVPQPASISFSITDGCNDGYRIEFRFFQLDAADQSTTGQWPEGNQFYFTRSYNQPYTTPNPLGCTSGRLVCYGARTGTYQWGLGFDGSSRPCIGDDCCYRCPTSGPVKIPPIRLICSR